MRQRNTQGQSSGCETCNERNISWLSWLWQGNQWAQLLAHCPTTKQTCISRIAHKKRQRREIVFQRCLKCRAMPERLPRFFPPHSWPPPLQVLIPSVKLDYSHVQSRCGSLDRRGYSAGGGNVSLVPQVHCLSVISVCSRCIVSFLPFSFPPLLLFPSLCHSFIKASLLFSLIALH